MFEREPADVDLIRRFLQEGDREAIGLFFQRHQDWTYRLALRLTHNPDDAADTVQTAFLKCLDAVRHYDERKGDTRQWLAGMILNLSRHTIRRHKMEALKTREAAAEGVHAVKQNAPATNAGNRATATAENRETSELIHQSLHQLPKVYGTTLSLRFLEGFTLKEVAAAMSTNEETVRRRVDKGLRLMRTKLAARGLRPESAAMAGLLSAVILEPAPGHLLESLQQMTVNPATAIRLASAGRAVAAVSGGSAKNTFWLWAAGCLGLAAVVGGSVFYSFTKPEVAAQVETTASPKITREWSFAEGPAKDLIPLCGEWAWWPADETDAAAMAATSATKTVIPLPVKIPARPMVLEFTGRGNVQDTRGILTGVAWAQDGKYPPSRSALLSASNRSAILDLCIYILDKRIVYVQDEKIVHYEEYEQPYPAEQLLLNLLNAKIEKITLREASAEKFPLFVREASFDKLGENAVVESHPAGIVKHEPPPPLLNKSWTFDTVPTDEFAVVSGPPWTWSPPTDGKPGVLALTTVAADAAGFTTIKIPATVFIRPFKMSWRLRSPEKESAGKFSIGWLPPVANFQPPLPAGHFIYYGNQKFWSRRTPPNDTRPGEAVSYTAYFIHRWVVLLRNDELRGICRYPRPYPSTFVYLGGYNRRLESLQLRELAADDIPAEYRNPPDLLKTENNDLRESTEAGPLFE